MQAWNYVAAGTVWQLLTFQAGRVCAKSTAQAEGCVGEKLVGWLFCSCHNNLTPKVEL